VALAIPNLNDASDTAGHAWFTVPPEMSTDGKMYVYDRNTGVLFNDTHAIAHPYSNIHPTFNADYKGVYIDWMDIDNNYYTVANTQTPLCPEGWTVPSGDQLMIMLTKWRWAKGYCFVITDGLNSEGLPLASLFPISGYSTSPSFDSIGYACPNPSGAYGGSSGVLASYATIAPEVKTTKLGFNLRCVHILPPPPVDPVRTK